MLLCRSCPARDSRRVIRQPESEVALLCRSGLKAELGAFYPLLLLRPLEAERPEPGQLYSALTALQELSAQPQLLVWSLVTSVQQRLLLHSRISNLLPCDARIALCMDILSAAPCASFHDFMGRLRRRPIYRACAGFASDYCPPSMGLSIQLACRHCCWPHHMSVK